ncbi:hypothetical protein CBE37_00805 [bacterium TMED277]|nr:MAG: hypothetical protein CBE37_00805 [bacterium TMED277]
MVTDYKSYKHSIYSNDSWIKVRTLINLRWLAIFGQLTTILISYFYLNIIFNIIACAVIILFSVIFNLFSLYFYTPAKRLSDFNAFLLLLYDLFQISILLFFSGGMTNPFSILIIVPVIVSATSLSIIFLFILGIITIISIIFLSFTYLPIYNSLGIEIEVPTILLIGFCTSLVITVTFLGGYARRVAIDTLNMNKALEVTQVALERERKLTAIAGVVAALGHELGSPLATIKLASSELLEDIKEKDIIYSDLKLIFDQANRCKDILADMGSLGKDDQYVKVVDFLELISVAIEPYKVSGKNILLSFNGNYVNDQFIKFKAEKIPRVRKEPELVHGIRNIIQNGINYSNSCVNVDLSTSFEFINLIISDDGPGYPENLLKMIGDPFLNKKENSFKSFNEKQDDKGMGLGLFISKILLERTGAEISYNNGRSISNKKKLSLKGAQVEISWKRTKLEVSLESKEGLIKKNPRNIT